jgi:uncharacterized protein involved in exopolysaccharide biosynthesis
MRLSVIPRARLFTSDHKTTDRTFRLQTEDNGADDFGLLDMAVVLARHLKLLILGPLVVALAAYAASHLVQPTFTATTTFLPPQHQQSAVASALASLGPLAGLTGAGARTPTDQYISMMESVTVSNLITDRFELSKVYQKTSREETRRILARKVRIVAGKKDGLISISVDDESPNRATEMANRYVEELRLLTSQLALTETQQRRRFFEQQLALSRERLVKAQQSLEESGFNSGALRVEPSKTAEAYIRARMEVTTAEVKLQSLRAAFADDTLEVRQQQIQLAGARAQLAKLEQAPKANGDENYIGKVRDFKYQEMLFELYARQFEVARIDEGREGSLIQVIDKALVPEKRSAPRRGFITVVAGLAAAAVLALYVLARAAIRRSKNRAGNAAKWAALASGVGMGQPSKTSP